MAHATKKHQEFFLTYSIACQGPRVCTVSFSHLRLISGGECRGTLLLLLLIKAIDWSGSMHIHPST